MNLTIEFASEASGKTEDGTTIQRAAQRVLISKRKSRGFALGDMPAHYAEALSAAVHDLWTFEVEKGHGHLELTEITVTIRNLRVK